MVISKSNFEHVGGQEDTRIRAYKNNKRFELIEINLSGDKNIITLEAADYAAFIFMISSSCQNTMTRT